MNVLLAVLLCLFAAAVHVLGDEYFPGHGTTVCIEIRPTPHGSPTKVCGPVVHGGAQQAGRPAQKAADPMVFNLPSPHHSSESDESREAEAPCSTGGQKSAMPSFPMRQAQPGPQPQPQPQPHPQHLMQRMDMPPEGMMPMMGMEFEGGGWRQAGPPCAHNHRASAPMGFMGGMMGGPMNRPPMPMQNSRSWMVNPQAMMMRGSDEPMMPPMHMGMRSADEKPPSSPPKKESLENLLKECEEKTKLLQEKEAKISELKTHMANKKEEEMKKKE